MCAAQAAAAADLALAVAAAAAAAASSAVAMTPRAFMVSALASVSSVLSADCSCFYHSNHVAASQEGSKNGGDQTS